MKTVIPIPQGIVRLIWSQCMSFCTMLVSFPSCTEWRVVHIANTEHPSNPFCTWYTCVIPFADVGIISLKQLCMLVYKTKVVLYID